MSLFDDILALVNSVNSLPPNPVAPENRGFARLVPSEWVPRGTVLRLSPSPELLSLTWRSEHRHETRPSILMHPKDIEALARECFPNARTLGLDIGQEIADAAEQRFAEIEAGAQP